MNRKELEARAKELKVSFSKDTSTEVLELQIKLAEKESLNIELNTALANTETAANSKTGLPVVKLKDGSYQFVVARFAYKKRASFKPSTSANAQPFSERIDTGTLGEIMLAKDAAKEPEFCQQLVDEGFKILVPVKEIKNREENRLAHVEKRKEFFRTQAETRKIG